MPQYEKGWAGGPGRPKGSRNRSTLLFDEIGREGIIELIRTVKKEAAEGDMRAAAIILARIWPCARGRTVPLDLPPVETAADVVQAHAAVIAAMAAEEITPEEARLVIDVLESQRRAIETNLIEPRLRAVEEQAAALKAAALKAA